MAAIPTVGNLEQADLETEIEWKVANFLSVTQYKEFVYCPTFSFAGISWFLQLKPKSNLKPGFICWSLVKVGCGECSVKYDFGLKKLDGSIEHLITGSMEGNIGASEFCYIKVSEIQQRQSEFAPSNVLIFTCTLKRHTTRSDMPKTLDLPKIDKLIKLETLSANFKSIFLNKESCDTTLLVMDKEYKAHKTVLMARSSVFAAMFLHETSEKQTGIVNISDCDPGSFEKFLEFLYTGKLEKPSLHCAYHLYETSNKYDVQELKKFCSEFLMENLTIENLCDVVILADNYDDKKLLSAVQCFFNKNLNSVFVSSEWDCLMKNNRRLANTLLIEMSKK